MSKLKAQSDSPASAPVRAQPAAPAVVTEAAPLRRTVDAAVALPRLPAVTRFLAWVHPMQWLVTVDGDVIPDIHRQYRVPGIAGIASEQVRDPNGAERILIDSDQSDLALTRKGFRPVPDDLVGSSVAVSCQSTGGTTWLARWERPHLGTAQVTVDRAELKRYVKALLAGGHTQHPRVDVLIAMKERLQMQADQASSRAERSHDKMRARAAEAFLFRVEAIQRVIDGGPLFFDDVEAGDVE